MKNPMLNDLKDSLKDNLKESLKDSFSDVAKTAAENLMPAAQKASDYLSSAMEKLEEATAGTSEQEQAEAAEPAEEKEPVVQEEPIEEEEEFIISNESALKIIYYLMSADGVISDAEVERFMEIGNSLDVNFRDHGQAIVKQCNRKLSATAGTADYDGQLRAGVREAIRSSRVTEDSFITPKLLLWDLFVTANVDGEYSKSESKLIKLVADEYGIDEATFLELETSLQTMAAIDREQAWLDTVDRPYREIEPISDELADRKIVIMESVRDLLGL